MKIVYCITLLLAVLPVAIFGLTEKDITEGTCSALKGKLDDQPIVDLKWMGSIEKWYVPMWSKLHGYQITSEALDLDFADISEDRIGKSCFLFMKDQSIIAFGKKHAFKIKGSGTAIEFKGPEKRAKSAKFTFKMTDNRSYILGVNCWEDDQVSWAVLSTTSTLTPETRNQVLDYVKVLGLNKANALNEDYSSCDGVKGEL